MKRLHIIGGKNHGKTGLVVELVEEFVRRRISVCTVKHTHHQHELDIPGKDSYRHRMAGATAVGILSPSITAMYLSGEAKSGGATDPYVMFARAFSHCELLLVEGDSQTTAPKIEVWRTELNSPPLAMRDKSILAIVTDDPISISANVLPRSDVRGLADWILKRLRDVHVSESESLDLHD
jgi:molybdopterin-guanine dinucleotide biosynthesis protein MobB